MGIDFGFDDYVPDEKPRKPKKEKPVPPEKKISLAIHNITESDYDEEYDDAYKEAMDVIKKHQDALNYEHLRELITSHTGENPTYSPLIKLVTEEVASKISLAETDILSCFAEYAKHLSLEMLLNTADWDMPKKEAAFTTAVEEGNTKTSLKIMELVHHFDLNFLAIRYDECGTESIYRPIKQHCIDLIAEYADTNHAEYRKQRSRKDKNDCLKSFFEEFENDKLSQEWQMASSYEIAHKSEAFGQSITSIFNFKSNKVHSCMEYNGNANFTIHDFADYDNQAEISAAYDKMCLLGPATIPEYEESANNKGPRIAIAAKRR